MNAEKREELLRNPSPYIEAQCVPGVACDEYESQIVCEIRRRRRLEPCCLGGQWWLLPTDPVIRGLATAINRAGKGPPPPLAEAAALHDYLVDRDIPVPQPILQLLAWQNWGTTAARSDRSGKLERVRAMVLTHAKISNREIARRCRCSEGYVRRIRGELSAHGAQIDDTITVRRGQSSYRMRRRGS